MLLKAGVIVAGATVLLGGIVFLLRHGGEDVGFEKFQGQPSIDRVIPQILGGALQLRGRSIIQLGVLLLIATPVARVILSLVGFAMERDRTYVKITAIVLGILLYSLAEGVLGN
ncbi:MAG: DUF1634 domain-containing protein [Acidobacteriota bacterium]|nr:DUF1634 domain-containing protein [Acidobacteriota bacterium]